jgi:FAD synthetase
MKKVMVFGTFDILHPGHIDFIRQAKLHGDFLYICVARDENVMQIKGKAPLNNLSQRIKALKAKHIGDEVFAGDQTDFFKAIAEKKPDIICLGYDQSSFGLREYLIKTASTIGLVTLKPFKEKMHKSSIIKKKKGL